MNFSPQNTGPATDEKTGESKKANRPTPFRLSRQNKEWLDALIARASRSRLGEKINSEDLIGYSQELLTDHHLQDISFRLLTNKDRIEILYRKLLRIKRGLSREEFLGILLEGKITH